MYKKPIMMEVDGWGKHGKQNDLKRLKTLDDQTIQASNPERFSLWDWCLYLCIKAQVKGILVL